MKRFTQLAVASAVLAFAAAAQAQSAGSVAWRVGGTQISPSVTSGNLSLAPAGTLVDVESASSLSGGITYMLTDNIALDVPLALPFKHTINGAGSFLGGVGKLAETKVLPATALLQYRFGAVNASFRPYVGAGLTYAMFFNETSTLALTAATGGTKTNPTTATFKDKLAASVQLGVNLQVSPKWFVDASYIYTPLETRGTLSTGQTIDVKLNPSTLSFGVGAKF
jgi:outer membrane protein